MPVALRVLSMFTFIIGASYLSYAYKALKGTEFSPHLFAIVVLGAIGVFHISSRIVVLSVRKARSKV